MQTLILNNILMEIKQRNNLKTFYTYFSLIIQYNLYIFRIESILNCGQFIERSI